MHGHFTSVLAGLWVQHTVFIAAACLDFIQFIAVPEGKYQGVWGHFISNKCLSVLIYPVCDTRVR